MAITIVDLLRAAGGSLVGKVRLQKVVYLLEQMGMESEFDFSYHHYGPYSEELADAVYDAVIFDEVEESSKTRADGVSYSIFELGEAAPEMEDEEMLGGLHIEQARSAIETMNRHSATVLEIAATIHWIACVEENEKWERELQRRKGTKAAAGRTEEAMRLLGELGLPPAA